MVLGELLAATCEHTTVNVVDCATGEIIARYDGKDSIDSELNSSEVVVQRPSVVPLTPHLNVAQLFVEIIR